MVYGRFFGHFSWNVGHLNMWNMQNLTRKTSRNIFTCRFHSCMEVGTLTFMRGTQSPNIWNVPKYPHMQISLSYGGGNLTYGMCRTFSMERADPNI